MSTPLMIGFWAERVFTLLVFVEKCSPCLEPRGRDTLLFSTQEPMSTRSVRTPGLDYLRSGRLARLSTRFLKKWLLNLLSTDSSRSAL